MQILVLNAGSSTLKYELFAMPDGTSAEAGVVERIGQGGPADHDEALRQVFADLGDAAVDAFGHRVVHGGETFSAPTRIDDAVVAAIEAVTPLAPLHNPAALAGIRAVTALRPDAPQVAVFDTAFHQTMPPAAYRYALPGWAYERHGVRRYGFHGTSHAYVAAKAAEFLGRPPEELNLVTLHLGNGASASAVRGGQCVDTTMGMTPLEGLVMGTRAGDVDPAVVPYLMRHARLTPGEIDRLLNKESGLLGLCGDADMRAVTERAEAGDAEAELALSIFCRRVRKYLGGYAFELGRLDAVVFTAGIGEHSTAVRRRVCAGLERYGITVDPAKNVLTGTGEPYAIHAGDADTAVLVVPTNEERAIADATFALVTRST
ncbi:MAG: acetate kinase [Planctomycetota bacterium]